MEAYRRSLLEAVKFLSVKEVMEVGTVSRLVKEICFSEEVWELLLGDNFNSTRLTLRPVPDPYTAYRQFHRKALYYVNWYSVYIYNVCSSATKVSLPKELPSDISKTSVVYIGWSTLFFLNSGQAFFIDFTSRSTTPLPDQPLPTQFSGLILYSGSVYVFCGTVNNQPSRSCSLFSLRSEQWAPLPDSVKPRRTFNPVLYKSSIILMNRAFEAFDPVASTFTLIATYSDFDYCTSSFIRNDYLYILSSDSC